MTVKPIRLILFVILCTLTLALSGCKKPCTELAEKICELKGKKSKPCLTAN